MLIATVLQSKMLNTPPDQHCMLNACLCQFRMLNACLRQCTILNAILFQFMLLNVILFKARNNETIKKLATSFYDELFNHNSPSTIRFACIWLSPVCARVAWGDFKSACI